MLFWGLRPLMAFVPKASSETDSESARSVDALELPLDLLRLGLGLLLVLDPSVGSFVSLLVTVPME